jgi:hypothetical protein
MTRLRLSINSEVLTVEVEGPFYKDPPPPIGPGPTPGLWDYEVTELFLLGENGSYVEIEIGPAGHYLILFLSQYRKTDTTIEALSAETKISKKCFKASLRLPMNRMPARPWRANAYAIHGLGKSRRYLACHRVDRSGLKSPDFHQLSFFKSI